ncbi:zinc finger protein 841-like isoform X2 [Amphibalanus amphitrite]|uniref:zinc finger protein 841-like isoform X2 n=2 Tax=Amphibalanus amphitrite TaxID=1232801 RepID=UPI001C904AA6|nr:zinc finger protein 841-like isoform X2 [Amphibalanus amphitrite]
MTVVKTAMSSGDPAPFSPGDSTVSSVTTCALGVEGPDPPTLKMVDGQECMDATSITASEVLENGLCAEFHPVGVQQQVKMRNNGSDVAIVEGLVEGSNHSGTLALAVTTEHGNKSSVKGVAVSDVVAQTAWVPAKLKMAEDGGPPTEAGPSLTTVATLTQHVDAEQQPTAPEANSAPLAASAAVSAAREQSDAAPSCAGPGLTSADGTCGRAAASDPVKERSPSAVGPPSDPSATVSATAAPGGTGQTVAETTEGSEGLRGTGQSVAESSEGSEGLTVTCDPAACSLSSAAAPGTDTPSAEGNGAAPSADSADAARSGGEGAVTVPPPDGSESELLAIGTVLVSGERLVFACAVCSEAFTSAGRLRSHHGRQHGPPPEPRASPPPPAEVTVGRRRRRRTRFVTTAATEDEDSPEEYPVMDEEDMAEGARRTRPSRGPSTSGVTSLKCGLCGKVLSSATKLAVHQRMHSGERPHICTYCPKRCNDLGNLRKHEQLHFKERPFRCDTCTITFWTAIRQRAHRCKLARSQENSDEAGDSMDMTEAGQSTSTEIPAESKETMILDSENIPMELSGSGLPALAAAAELAAARPPREPSPKREPNANSGQAPVVPVDCDVCGRQLRSVSGWQRHRRLHAGVRPYLCRFCDKTCNDSGNMRKHEAGHFKERPYRCDTCCITFVNTWRLGMHQCKLRADGGPPTEGSAPSPTMSSAAAEVEVEAVLESRPALPVPPPRGRHAPPPQLDARGRRRDHVCPVCSKAMLSYASLEMHYRTHTGEKPYQCDECGKRFSIQGNLVVHARIHTGERPFQCDECGKMFMYQSHLKVHKRGHSGARPFRCQFCQKGFAASSSKRVHEQTVHSNERKFICEACGATFKEKKHLKRHGWRKHQIGEEPVL